MDYRRRLRELREDHDLTQAQAGKIIQKRMQILRGEESARVNSVCFESEEGITIYSESWANLQGIKICN